MRRRARELVLVDFFAGGGGVTQAAKQAGYKVALAINHKPEVVEFHARRHPDVQHVCQDVNLFDHRLLPDMDVLWASPDCKVHSSGSQPGRARSDRLAEQHKRMRMTAMTVVEATEVKRPRAVVVENVLDFEDWDLYEWWLDGFRQLGYSVTVHRLIASHWGVPQDRTRLIVVASKRKPIQIEEPFLLKGQRPPIGPHLDFDDGEWIPIKEIATPGARGRAQHAHAMFKGKPCWGQHVTHVGAWGRSVNRPANTITTQDQHYLVAEGLYRRWTVAETAAAQGFARDYFDGVETRGLAMLMAGNAVPVGMGQGILEQVGAAL